MNRKIKTIVLCGQTASGKSALGMALAERIDCEIVAMDSMQVYRGMDIGTAKPTREEQARVPHHMIDIVSPKDEFTVAEYVDRVQPILEAIAARGKIPMLIGGTGLYLQSLMHGMNLGNTGENKPLREELNRIALFENGHLLLHERLAAVDPDSAQRLHPNDLRRVIRAIEIYEETGVPASQYRNPVSENERFDFLPIAIRMDRSLLYQKLEHRVDRMLSDGLLREVETLLADGVTPGMQSMQGIGYKELIPVIRGETDLTSARKEMVISTRHYAKRQETWFKREAAVHWLDYGSDVVSSAEKLYMDWIEKYAE